MIRVSKLPAADLKDIAIIPTLLLEMEKQALIETEQAIAQNHVRFFNPKSPTLINPFDALTELEACLSILRYVIFSLQDHEKRAAFLRTDNTPFKKEPAPMTALLLCVQTISLALKIHPTSTLDRPWKNAEKERWHSDYLIIYNSLVNKENCIGPRLFSFWEIRLLKLVNIIDSDSNLFSEEKAMSNKFEYGIPELFFAAKYGHLQLAKHAIDEGDDINRVFHNVTALDTAVKRGQKEVVLLLLSQKDVNINIAPAEKNHSTLFFALKHYVSDPTPDNSVTLDLLINKNARFIEKDCSETLKDGAKKIIFLDQHRNTPLHFAATFKLYRASQLLLDVGADLNSKNNFGVSAEEILQSFLDDQEKTKNTLSQKKVFLGINPREKFSTKTPANTKGFFSQ